MDTNIIEDVAGTQDPPQPSAPPESSAPPPQDPTNPDPLDNPVVQLAIERSRSEAYREALQRQDPVPTSVETPAAALPTNPLDLMTAQQREAWNQKAVIDPAGAQAELAEVNQRLIQAHIAQAGAPLVSAQAQTFVDLFKSRMARETSAQLYTQIEPLFDALLRGLNLSPLATMPKAQRDSELTLRWSSAENQVLKKQIQAAPKPEPRLQGGGAPGSPSSQTETVRDRVKRFPWLMDMAKIYNYSDEQLEPMVEAAERG